MLEEPLFGGSNPNASTSNSYSSSDSQEIAVLERQLLRVISLMDPNVAPLLQRHTAAGQVCIAGMACRISEQGFDDSMHQHQILLVHPKKFGRQLYRDLQEQARTCHQQLAKRSLLSVSTRSQNNSDHFMLWWHSESSRHYKLQILALLVGAETTDPICAQMKQDRKAMRIKWFRELVNSAVSNVGCAVALKALQPQARKAQNHNNFITAVIVIIALLYIIPIYMRFWI